MAEARLPRLRGRVSCPRSLFLRRETRRDEGESSVQVSLLPSHLAEAYGKLSAT